MPGGNRTAQEANAGGRKATGTRDEQPPLQAVSRITGRIWDDVPGPGRVLTWAG
jgi:hypothetical protein